MLTQKSLHIRDILDARHHKKALPTAIMLAQQRLAQGDGVKLADIGPNGQPINRRCPDDRQIAHTGQRQLQGPGDGCGRERQHMHVRSQLLELFFMSHAETLFLINDQKPKVFEPHLIREHSMGADHDVHRAAGHPITGCIGLFRRDKTGQLPDLEWKASEPLGKAFRMLTRKQRRWRNHRHLQPTTGRHKCRPHRNFSLAKANIAANQAVHRAASAQIFNHV